MKERFVASGVHFGLSVSVISLFFLLVFFVWYPYPYYQFYATWDVLKILVGVDIVLGPLLTLVVFNKMKKQIELRRDLAIIIFIQVAALLWGMHVTYSARPVFLVFSNGTFFSFAESELDMSNLKHKELKPGPFDKPTIVYLKGPKDNEEYKSILFDIAQNGTPDLIYRTNRYLPVSEYWERIYNFSLPNEKLANSGIAKSQIEDIVNESQLEFEDLAFFRIRSGKAGAIAVFNKRSNEIVTTVALMK